MRKESRMRERKRKERRKEGWGWGVQSESSSVTGIIRAEGGEETRLAYTHTHLEERQSLMAASPSLSLTGTWSQMVRDCGEWLSVLAPLTPF